MRELIEKLERAGEFDLDACDEAIAAWLYANPRLCGALVNYDPALWLERNGGWVRSLDAALALAERVLPGWGWDVSSNTEHIKACIDPELGEPVAKHPHWAAVSRTSSKQFHDAATPALALCIAVLRATTPAEADAVGTEPKAECAQSQQPTPEGREERS